MRAGAVARDAVSRFVTLRHAQPASPPHVDQGSDPRWAWFHPVPMCARITAQVHAREPADGRAGAYEKSLASIGETRCTSPRQR